MIQPEVSVVPTGCTMRGVLGRHVGGDVGELVPGCPERGVAQDAVAGRVLHGHHIFQEYAEGRFGRY